ncbi:MAG: diguanylate cyclase [Pseudomonadota bacterium]
MDPNADMSMQDSVLHAVNLGVVVLDAERRVLLWNHWMEQHAGRARAAVLGQDFFVLFPELADKRVDAAVRQALHDRFPSVLSQTLHKAPFPLYASAQASAAGLRIQQAVAVTPLTVGSLACCLIQISDVTVAVNREKLLREQALELRSQTFSDGLTGIANRRHFDIAVDKEVRRAKRAGTPLSLLMIDIDCFKAYNDQYGHQQGDDCLIKVAAALAGLLHRPTDLIARYGGEEFAVVLPDLDAAQGAALAEVMRNHVANLNIPLHEGGPTPRVTVSIGVASQPTGAPVEVAALIGAADRALYMAKRGGRDRVVARDPEPAEPMVPPTHCA